MSLLDGREIKCDESYQRRRAIVRRHVTAWKATREQSRLGYWTWEGVITDHAVVDAATGEVRGVCILTARDHTWLDVRTYDDPCGLRVSTTIEFPES
jgi:hypothetical protein